jgi:hypothetical protein
MMTGLTRKPAATTSSFIHGFLVVMICAGFAGCGEATTAPEDAVRAWIASGVALAEDKDRRALLDMISPAYADARGNKRDDISNLFRVYFLRQHKVALLTRIEELQIYGDSAAQVTLAIGMAGTNDGTFGFSADAYRFALELEHDGDDWQLIAARWGELGEELR